MPNIVPIKELKNTVTISQMCHESSEPIFITKNGYGDMVIMSIEVFEELNFKKELYKKIDVAEEDIEFGRIKQADLAIAEIEEKYGL